ncbi:response regulator [Microcoleus sp. bin38.metabat.b11b12b14.051]|uniref:response regulator n=1 Tax=Microcoleus sp. bin38.metabat.b11b12b14.051 TaxID=2742709 RepID=UPI0025F0D7A7|nr:response regulator [Microcoleus sp. bin38.metabat.b11b12b14.051]
MAKKFMKKPVIVCIDDEPDVLNSLKIELKKAMGDQCIIETADGGEDALELLADLRADEHEIALVVSDYIMPDIKGDELLQIIHERSPNTLTIMLTGQADLQALSNSIKYAKLYRYIQKPWQKEDLKLTVVEAVHSYLQEQKLADEVIKGREANKQLQIVNEALSATESRLNQFLAALPVGVSVYNSDGSIAYINHAAHLLLDAGTELADAMLGNSLEQVASSQFYEAENDRLYFPENFPILRALRGEFVKVSEVEVIQYGLTITLEISARPIFDNQGNIVFAIAVIQDISQRKELENFLANYQRTLEGEIVERTEQLQKAAFAAEAANRAKSTFLANMSHELRTPLNAILGFTQIVEPSPNLTAEDRENLRIIYRSGEHLLTLINQALDLAKIEAGRMTLLPSNFDLYRLLDELQEMFELRARNQDLQLIFQRGADLPQYLRTDEVKLRQVLINLLSNAMKFTQIGGVSVRVRRKLEGTPAADAIANTTKISEEGEIINPLSSSIYSDFGASNNPENPRISTQSEIEKLAITDNSNISSSLLLEFEIADTGVGIAQEELGNLFQAFVQTESGQKTQQGTGLGLTISREFVRLMGGYITVESQLEIGTTFRFDIAVDAVDSAKISTPKIIREVMGVEPDVPCYRILIVDDRADNRKLLVKMLSALGFAVEEARNGAVAVEIWENWQPHLIFMDLRMPVMDGYEATIEIRSRIQQRMEEQEGDREMDIPNPEFLCPKIIALTASTHEDKRSFSLLVGCDDFIRKPFRKTDIFDTLTKHLGVSYIYSDSTGSDSTGDRQNLSNPSSAVLACSPKLPAEWTDNMKQAIRSADFDLIGTTIDEIRDAYPEFAAILQSHLDNFDYQKIINLIMESEKSNSTVEG